MSPVVHSLSAVPDADVEAIATYFADIDRAADRMAATDQAVMRAISYAPLGTGQEFDADARLYMAACASCHYNAGKPLALRPDLALNTAVNLPDPSNFIQVVLHGVAAKDGMPGVVMPSFRIGVQRPRHRAYCRLSAPHAHKFAALARPRQENRRTARTDEPVAMKQRLRSCRS